MTVRELIDALIQIDDWNSEVRFVDYHGVYDGDCAITGLAQKPGLVELTNEGQE